MKYLPVRTISQSKPLISTRSLTWALVLSIAFLIGLTIDTFKLTPEFLDAKTAVAAEIPVIHQNDWYCEHIKSGYYPNTYGKTGSLVELCAKWGVDL